MPRDDAATATAKQETLAALERELGGSVGREPIGLGGEDRAQPSVSPSDPAAPAPAAASPEALPFGHDSHRLGGTVVAGPPDDAFEMAQQEVLAALFGAPTPGAL